MTGDPNFLGIKNFQSICNIKQKCSGKIIERNTMRIRRFKSSRCVGFFEDLIEIQSNADKTDDISTIEDHIF